MDPNSQHQRWSFWEYVVYPDWNQRPSYATVKENCARFGRKTFGSASQMSIRCLTDGEGRLCWEIKILSEGHPVHDPQYVEWMHGHWRTFFAAGFGATCEVRVHARLMAGDRENGLPPDQLIIMPPLIVEKE